MKKIHVYPHTHWDYEWYFTSNESIIQLVYHMDEVINALEDGDLETYLLDGQLSILDEYIRFMPSNFERVKKLVEEGKLIIGPWYTQTDELIIDGESIARNLFYGIKRFMPSNFERVKKLVEEGKLIIGPWYTQTDELIIDGESIARNLFYGIKSASKYGDYLKVGYLPDSFGQSKDMPKILNGFDIKRSIFWRGVSKDVCPNREFIWKGEDDSSLLVYNIKNGYFYGGNLIYTDDVEKVEKTILDGSQTDNILLPVGGDQRFVDFNLKERIKYYNDRTKNDFEYVESSCDKFFDELEKSEGLKEVKGEFVNPSNSKIHRSIYSSRYDHKYLNDKIERRLIYQLEPLMVIAQNLGLDPKVEMIEEIWKKLLMNQLEPLMVIAQILGLDPKVEMIEEIWKKLLMNHAQDSAWGCNSDKSSRSIISRLTEAYQLSYAA